MFKTNLLVGGLVMLLGGIALWIYGYNLEPTFGEAVSNIFDGDFTDKRNLLMFGGIVLAVLGGASLAGGVLGGGRNLRAA
jgi:hypothetical protein